MIGTIARGLLAILLGVGLAGPARAQSPDDLRGMTLEQLMNVEVTTVSRTATSWLTTPAALYVITAEDIRRSGVTSLAEALRLAPGVQVARIDAGKWAVGVRGFADRLSRSMLVLIDGRAVYSPLFAGTYWETQDVVLADIERIEVIRGPGGTLWGSNAVNGIISIVTRSAAETQGLLVAASVGTEERAQGTVRYGFPVGERGHARAYVTGFDRAHQHATGALAYDGWRLVQGGVRYDTPVRGDQTLTVQGDLYAARLGEFVRQTSLTAPFVSEEARDLPLYGGNLLARWSGALGERGSFQLQTFYEHTDRDEYPVSETRETFDVDGVMRRRVGDRHALTWGAGWRLTTGRIRAASTAYLPSGPEHLLGAFVHDDLTLLPDRLNLAAGVKLEHNAYSGLEVQPSLRASWQIGGDGFVWAGVARAVRRPSRVEREYRTTSILNAAVPAFIRLTPNPDFMPERLLSYEVGFRLRPTERLYVTVAGFHDRWNDLLSTELGDAFEEPGTPPRLILPVHFGNGLDGVSNGGEVAVDVRPDPRWRLVLHYGYLDVRMTQKPDANDVTQEGNYEEGAPRHQVRLQNSLTLGQSVTLDWNLRWVDELPAYEVDAYATSDVRVAWQASPALELEVVGRNLHEPWHVEWPGDNGGADVGIQRGMYVGLTWRQ